MKRLTLLLAVYVYSTALFSQNITNTLGASGLFTIKDASNNYLTLDQSTGQVNILKTLRLENTTGPSVGVIFKGAVRFLHNYGDNTFIGLNSGNFTLTGSDNTGIGRNSLYSNTTGYNNTALGYYSLYSNTFGTDNTALGSFSLSSNTTGNYNTALGFQSLSFNTTGNYNTALGYQSLSSNTTAAQNTAVGHYSLAANTTGFDNTAVGFLSLRYSTTGFQNTALGNYSLQINTTGNNNTAIGYDAQVPSGTADNQVRIGNTDVGYAGVQVAWTITSDKRWKSDIKSSALGLSFISKLNPVSYTRINDEKKRTEYGLIAQEVEKVLKESDVENAGMLTIDDNGKYELRYNDLLAPMIKAIQELKAENIELKVKNEHFKAANEELKATTVELTGRLNNFEQTQNMLVNEIEKLKTNSDTETKVSLGEK